jgi:formylmethanofuran dehydrogenase subunit E
VKNVDTNIEADLTVLMEKAADFHGHLGPFLVIGIRMGNMAKRVLKPNSRENRLQAAAKIPFSTPFSCVLDGIQATTKCTIGNQKLKIENSQKEITVQFKLENSNKTMQVSVNPGLVEKLMNRFSEGASNEELAREIAHTPENQLFTIEKK